MVVKDGNTHPLEIVKGEGVRYVHTPGLYFSMKPEIEEVTIYDSVCLFDYLFKFKAYFSLHFISLAFFFSRILYLFLPIVWMDITERILYFLATKRRRLSYPLVSSRFQPTHFLYGVQLVQLFGIIACSW